MSLAKKISLFRCCKLMKLKNIGSTFLGFNLLKYAFHIINYIDTANMAAGKFDYCNLRFLSKKTGC